MKCINCGLINPETAVRCDCGYDFATQSMMASYVPGYESPLRICRLPAFVHTVIVFVGVGPLVGFFFSFFIPALTEGIGSLSTNDLYYIGALLLAAYWIGSIPALGTGILYSFLQLILPPRITRSLFWRAALCGAIGTAVTGVYCHLVGLSSDLILWAGLPAGVVCGIIARNQIESTRRRIPSAEWRRQ
jgi:hypothetical protein